MAGGTPGGLPTGSVPIPPGQLMPPGGTVVVSDPFAWRRHAYPSDYFRFTVEGLKELFRGIKVIATAYHYGNEVESKGKIPAAEIDGVKYIARTEAFFFGER